MPVAILYALLAVAFDCCHIILVLNFVIVPSFYSIRHCHGLSVFLDNISSVKSERRQDGSAIVLMCHNPMAQLLGGFAGDVMRSLITGMEGLADVSSQTLVLLRDVFDDRRSVAVVVVV